MSDATLTQRAMNVLVVDDSKSMRHLIGAVLRELGHRALTARDADAALQYFSEKRIDLVLVDVEMPGMDGFELTRALRERLANDWIPIVFLSSRQEAELIERGIEAGGDDYLTKPINPTVLRAKLVAMSRISNMRRDLLSAQAQLASYRNDPLTGVPGKTVLIEKLLRLWRDCRRDDQPVSLIRTDVMELEQINHTNGVDYGDRILVSIGHALIDNAPEGSVYGRIDGDEFIVCWPCALDDAQQWWDDHHDLFQARDVMADCEVKGTVLSMNAEQFDSLSDLLDVSAAQVSVA
ncbi:response regulator [Litorivicinus lipolyticus]|uniref:Response regulator n=1 Tax=Litorivicinus lipolyticus TaxID=418701 RepID=A0A5Q2Q817_9GAMM|nr:response regulator [Litorivicinus lipolyticus]QGG80238.1 response regulator [Litorivicinus lipolyticus]